jgi:hypothetical protein
MGQQDLLPPISQRITKLLQHKGISMRLRHLEQEPAPWSATGQRRVQDKALHSAGSLTYCFLLAIQRKTIRNSSPSAVIGRNTEIDGTGYVRDRLLQG